MAKRMLIDATHPEETRVVVISGKRLEEFDFETASKKQLKGNIYLAKVTRVEPSLQAAFVDYGGNRHGFLAFSEIHPDYYRIPVADREALLAEEAAFGRRGGADDDDDEDRGAERPARSAPRRAPPGHCRRAATRPTNRRPPPKGRPRLRNRLPRRTGLLPTSRGRRLPWRQQRTGWPRPRSRTPCRRPSPRPTWRKPARSTRRRPPRPRARSRRPLAPASWKRHPAPRPSRRSAGPRS